MPRNCIGREPNSVLYALGRYGKWTCVIYDQKDEYQLAKQRVREKDAGQRDYILNGPDQRTWNCVKHLTPWGVRFPLKIDYEGCGKRSVNLGGIDRTRKDVIYHTK